MPIPLRHALRLAAMLALSTTPAAAQQRPCDEPTPLGPSRDLYCMELVAAPGMTGVSGRVELGHPSGPFTVAVGPDGRPRFRLILSAAGLPPPASLGRYSAYVAWLATPTMGSIARLGAVRNGSTALGIVDQEKFTLLVTAERSLRAREPSGRVVLRGQSPATRLFPPDLLLLTLGSTPARAGSPRDASGEHSAHDEHDAMGEHHDQGRSLDA